MTTVTVKTNFPQVMAKLSKMGDDIATKATISAMNKTLAQGRTVMLRAITQEFAIKQADVRPQLEIKKALFTRSAVNATASLEAFGRRRGHRSRNVMLFGAKQIRGRKIRRVQVNTARGVITRRMRVGGGVSVRIKRVGSRKLIEGAFIANKGRTVFMRKPGGGRAISAVETVDVPQMFNTRRVNRLVVQVIQERYPRIFESEARFFINKFSRG